jgi:hypothetical protein
VVMVERVHAPTIHRKQPMGHLPNRYWIPTPLIL